MTEKYNADLANGLGNLVSRSLKLSEDMSVESRNEALALPVSYDGTTKLRISEFNLSATLENIWRGIRNANKFIDEQKPWELKKTDKKAFEEVMKKILWDLVSCAHVLRPFLPSTAEKIEAAFKTGKVEPLFQRIK